MRPSIVGPVRAVRLEVPGLPAHGADRRASADDAGSVTLASIGSEIGPEPRDVEVDERGSVRDAVSARSDAAYVTRRAGRVREASFLDGGAGPDRPGRSRTSDDRAVADARDRTRSKSSVVTGHASHLRGAQDSRRRAPKLLAGHARLEVVESRVSGVPGVVPAQWFEAVVAGGVHPEHAVCTGVRDDRVRRPGCLRCRRRGSCRTTRRSGSRS